MPARRTPLLLACTLGTSLAHAQGNEVATARQLAIQGIDAVESGDCAAGAPLLERAEHLHHASVHLQYLARCRLAEGKLVAATELWRRILRDGAPPGSSPALVAAVAEATTQLEKTLPRLSTTTLRTSERYPDLVLVLDGTPLSPELVGAPQILDPGRHTLTARAPGFEPWSKRWKVAAGAAAEVVIELEPQPRTGATAPDAAVRRGGPPPFLEPAGWVTASVGAASIIAGSVTTLMRNNRRTQLENLCPGRVCEKENEAQMNDDIDAVHSLTTASNVLLFGGGALLAGGVLMIVVGRTSPPEKAGREAAFLPGAPGADAGLTFRERW